MWKFRTIHYSLSTAATKSLQSCPTLCDPIDGSSPGSTVPGILQARTLEWVAISFSNAWKGKVKVKSLSCVQLLATPWTAPHQAPLSMGFSRQEYWSGVPLPSPIPLAQLWVITLVNFDMVRLHWLVIQILAKYLITFWTLVVDLPRQGEWQNKIALFL